MKNDKWVPQWVVDAFQQEKFDLMTDHQLKKSQSVDWNKFAQEFERVKKNLDPLGMAIQKTMPSVGTIWVNSEEETWNGSGFLIANKRFITARHVVVDIPENGEIVVSFDEKNMFSAKVASADVAIDAAVLILDEVPEGIQPLKFANPNDISVGENIAVIGSPSGWHNVVTTGIISAVNKSLNNIEEPSLQNMILIDADIESGSSGSPVIDVDGNVIGIVMALIGENAESGIGQRAVSPVSKIIQIIEQTHKSTSQLV